MASTESMSQEKRSCAFPNWLERNRFSHTQFSMEELRNKIEQDNVKITVIIPGKKVASTVAGVITKTVQPLIDAGIVSRLVVIDAASLDGTGAVAASHGAKVIQRKDIASELGSPFVNIDGVRMFRDVGGYQTSDGSSVRKGLMFRSGDPSSMTPDGLDSFQKLAIGKVFDLRSPIETTTFIHGHARHADSGFASPDESDSDEVKSTLLSTGVEVIAAPVFPDEEWLPQRRDDRLKQYASAAQVRTSTSPLKTHF
jgi:hypothetical protein